MNGPLIQFDALSEAIVSAAGCQPGAGLPGRRRRRRRRRKLGRPNKSRWREELGRVDGRHCCPQAGDWRQLAPLAAAAALSAGSQLRPSSLLDGQRNLSRAAEFKVGQMSP